MIHNNAGTEKAPIVPHFTSDCVFGAADVGGGSDSMAVSELIRFFFQTLNLN